MSSIYDQAEKETYALAAEIMEAHHQDLRLPDGTFPRLCILMAAKEEGDEPAVKSHGYPCAAVVSVIPYKQRVDKRADAEIVIDEEAWKGFSDPEKRALLDHEITHLEIQKDDVGCVKTDDFGRPKLKLRLHDWQLGGFASIAKRYGADAIERQEFRKAVEGHGEALGVAKEAKLFPVA